MISIRGIERDGFTQEVYESFCDLIWRDFLNSNDAAF